MALVGFQAILACMVGLFSTVTMSVKVPWAFV